MKLRFKHILLIVLFFLLILSCLFVLKLWTDKYREKKNLEQLEASLSDMLDKYGEKGLLEKAGLKVEEVYYLDDDSVSVFAGKTSDWKYSSDELINRNVYESCIPAVVCIKTISNYTLGENNTGLAESGTGSGFFVREDGLILTNEHVISNAVSISVETYDGSSYTAKTVGEDVENDLALIRIYDSEKSFKTLEFEDSDLLFVGQKVIALGNPLGFEFSMSEGHISGLSRSLRSEDGRILLGAIQSDTAVSPGNSGGPLLNSSGKVVGINSSIYRTSVNDYGINFAISSNQITQSPLLIEALGRNAK